VLGVRDIVVRIHTTDYRNVYADPVPALDPTPFFSDLKDAQKYFSSYFSILTYPQALIFSLKNLIF
jgi:hypothetical protein